MLPSVDGFEADSISAGSKLSDKEEQRRSAVSSSGRENPGGKSFQACVLRRSLRIPKEIFDLICCFHASSSIVSPQHQASRDHVVQRLLSFRKSRHDVSDKCRHHVGDNLGKVPPRRSAEANALSGHVRYHQTQ